MQRLALSTTLVVALVGTASAQLTYDAGTAGNPPVAPSPVTQGWTESLSGTVSVTDVSPDPSVPLNAWQITDTGPGEGSYRYTGGNFEMPHGWESSLTMRMLAGSVFLSIDTGDLLTHNLYVIEFEVVGNDVLVHRPNGAPFVCAGAANNEYHTYRFLIVSPTVEQVLFWFDGEPYGWVEYYSIPGILDGWFMDWGTGDAEAGRARIHHAYFGPAASFFLDDGVVCFGNPGSLSVVGSAVVADDDLTLVATGLPAAPNIGYFIMGTGSNTFTPPGSAGAICVSPGIQRYLPPVQNTSQLVDGGFWRSVGTSGPVSSAITAGSRWGFQGWHRDGMNPSNLTRAVFVDFQ